MEKLTKKIQNFAAGYKMFFNPDRSWEFSTEIPEEFSFGVEMPTEEGYYLVKSKVLGSFLLKLTSVLPYGTNTGSYGDYTWRGEVSLDQNNNAGLDLFLHATNEGLHPGVSPENSWGDSILEFSTAMHTSYTEVDDLIIGPFGNMAFNKQTGEVAWTYWIIEDSDPTYLMPPGQSYWFFMSQIIVNEDFICAIDSDFTGQFYILETKTGTEIYRGPLDDDLDVWVTQIYPTTEKNKFLIVGEWSPYRQHSRAFFLTIDDNGNLLKETHPMQDVESSHGFAYLNEPRYNHYPQSYYLLDSKTGEYYYLNTFEMQLTKFMPDDTVAWSSLLGSGGNSAPYLSKVNGKIFGFDYRLVPHILDDEDGTPIPYNAAGDTVEFLDSTQTTALNFWEGWEWDSQIFPKIVSEKDVKIPFMTTWGELFTFDTSSFEIKHVGSLGENISMQPGEFSEPSSVLRVDKNNTGMAFYFENFSNESGVLRYVEWNDTGILEDFKISDLTVNRSAFLADRYPMITRERDLFIQIASWHYNNIFKFSPEDYKLPTKDDFEAASTGVYHYEGGNTGWSPGFAISHRGFASITSSGDLGGRYTLFDPTTIWDSLENKLINVQQAGYHGIFWGQAAPYDANRYLVGARGRDSSSRTETLRFLNVNTGEVTVSPYTPPSGLTTSYTRAGIGTRTDGSVVWIRRYTSGGSSPAQLSVYLHNGSDWVYLGDENFSGTTQRRIHAYVHNDNVYAFVYGPSSFVVRRFDFDTWSEIDNQPLPNIQPLDYVDPTDPPATNSEPYGSHLTNDGILHYSNGVSYNLNTQQLSYLAFPSDILHLPIFVKSIRGTAYYLNHPGTIYAYRP